MPDFEKRRVAERLKLMQWDVNLMMGLTPDQRRTIDDAVKALEQSPLFDSLRSLLPPGHPMAQ